MKTLRRFRALSWLAVVALSLGLTVALGVASGGRPGRW